MFYFDVINNKKVLKTDFLEEITAFFTTRAGLPDIMAKRVITPTQTHSANVEHVDDRTEYPNTDGLILTNTEDEIYLRFADCTPIIFYDKKQKIGAISHAGWKGTVEKIAVKTVEKMKSSPEDIIVAIGPAISLCCYEVSEDIKDKLLATVINTQNLYIQRNVDLKQINARQLQEIGVNKIDICPYCTSCNNDLFYSYRKENGTKERHYAALKLKP